ncbi:PHB depolymerase family esterase [Lacibacterium aquatile]|uniref:PHB depolymerase family esterase n=1 Tax=Lacibacterium aquatile TaxID=1168082 RepID=A0ABW5DVK5_9PROT
MAGLEGTIFDLALYRRQWEALHARAEAQSKEGDFHPPADRLEEVRRFGPNPGRLRMFCYVPKKLAPSPALVVVLHGCTQSAAIYDHGSGWSQLADRHGFAVLYPEQDSGNNPKTCFNWFRDQDTARDGGEALSIRQMIARMVADHGIDPARIFVTGLSAGGAMTAVMLATYPEVFAGGAIIAGLPYRAASTVQDALHAMFQGTAKPAAQWGDLVRSASRHTGPWPKVAIWQGDADETVVPMNADELVKQWTDVHGISQRTPTHDEVGTHPRRSWRDSAGKVAVQEIRVHGLGHGTPVDTRPDRPGPGVAGPHLLDIGLSSTYLIAEDWGLTDVVVTQPRVKPVAPPEPDPISDLAAIFSKALKSAGLIR